MQPAVRNHPHEMSERKRVVVAWPAASNDPEVNILVAIANDDAENVAKLATDTLKAAKIGLDWCPDPILTMASLGIVSGLDDDGGGTHHGLKLKGGMTLLDIAQSNKKQAAAGALLP